MNCGRNGNSQHFLFYCNGKPTVCVLLFEWISAVLIVNGFLTYHIVFFKSLSSICYIVLSFSFRFRDNEAVEEVVLYGKKASLLCGFQNQPELKAWNE